VDRLATIADLAAGIRDRRVSPTELVEKCLLQIERSEPELRAWVIVDAAGARQRAGELTDQAARGELLGPLHGIPVGIKDIIDVAGWPTRAGSPLRAAHVAGQDAVVVARLRDAGAIVLGKTVTTEFAWIDPPPTRNPINAARTPGGSSSGSAVAVASEMCVAALGSQTGGSIVRPASYCGVCGLKPTFGRVSRKGVVPLSPSLDHVGPIGRCVGDLAVMLSVIAGHDPDDPFSVDRPSDDYSRELDRTAPPKLGWVEDFFAERASDEVRSVTRAAMERIQNAGASVITIPLPKSFSEVHAMHRRIMAFEAAREHGDLFRQHADQFGRHIAALLQEGRQIAQHDYQAARDHQQRFQADIEPHFMSVEALVMPATDTTAPADLSTTGNPAFQSPWSYAGVPVVSIPCDTAPDGLPCALQLVGPKWSEANLLAIAAWCQQTLSRSRAPHGT
jgi:Asp-tRNA(Asn)/Glu-tRNA(Gln) amidotransferase A subunit family amidase